MAQIREVIGPVAITFEAGIEWVAVVGEFMDQRVDYFKEDVLPRKVGGLA